MYLLEIVSVGVIGIELPLKMDQSESDVGRNEAGSLENFGVWLICFYSGTSKQNSARKSASLFLPRNHSVSLKNKLFYFMIQE
jgi:hypothetical protein